MRIEDESLAVREVQRFLLAAAESDPRIPISPIDGIFGDETREAVAVFQRINGLPDTGYADEKTFALLYAAHTEREEALIASRTVFNNGNFPLGLGSHGRDVAHLHVILGELSEQYELDVVPRGDFFTYETEAAVLLLQDILLYERTARVDEVFFLRLMNEAIYRKSFKTRI